jgi:putative two-component system response regulator
MAIADVYDALVSERPYKKAFTHKESIDIFIGNRGTQFDPALVDLFLLYESEFEKVAGLIKEEEDAVLVG